MEGSPETRLFRAYWEDGTLDLVAGGAVVLIGLGYLFELFLAPVIAVPLAFAAWYILRERVVEPRAGYVEFSRKRRERSVRRGLGAFVLGVAFLTLLLVLAIRADIAPPRLRIGVELGDGGSAVDVAPALLVALAALITAWLTRAWRFAVYAAVIAAAGVVALLVGAGPALPVVTGGAVVLGTGAVLFGRFLAESRRAMAKE